MISGNFSAVTFFACASCINITKLFFPFDVSCIPRIIYSGVGLPVSASPDRQFQSTLYISFWFNSSFACFFISAYFPPTYPPGNLNKCELKLESPIAFCTIPFVLLNSSKTISGDEYIVEYTCE